MSSLRYRVAANEEPVAVDAMSPHNTVMTDSHVPDDFRWQSFFQHSAEPLFLLNRRRRLLFANRAWETLTGLTVVHTRGKTAKRRPWTAASEPWEWVLATLVPPAEVWRNEMVQVRRRFPGPRAAWWEIAFLPILGRDEVLGVLGKIRALETPATPVALPEKLVALKHRFGRDNEPRSLLGDTPAQIRLREQLQLAGQSRTPVFFWGPSASENHEIARRLHGSGSTREASFARLSCQLLPPGAIANWLQQVARKTSMIGTAYFEDVDRLPAEIQQQLQEVIGTLEDSGPRWLASATAAPHEAIAAGRLTSELGCRLSVLTIAVPGLDECTACLKEIVDKSLERANELNGAKVKNLSVEAWDVVRAHAWPGQFAELDAVLREACGRATGETIESEHLPFYLRAQPTPSLQKLPLDELLEKTERRLIGVALDRSEGNKTRAAEMLGIWRARLIRRMAALGLGAEEAE